MNWAWLRANAPMIRQLLGEHVVSSIAPVVVALALAIPLGWLIARSGRAAGVVLSVVGLVYAVPSLAMFVALPVVLNTKILDPLNVMVALTIYSLVLLLRSVVDGFGSVPDEVQQSAVAMGMGASRRWWVVDLPLALPVVLAGLRVATVSNIALVSVGAVIGQGALGRLFDVGFNGAFYTPIIVGIVLSMALALLADLLIVGLGWLLLPWTRAHSAPRRPAQRTAAAL